MSEGSNPAGVDNIFEIFLNSKEYLKSKDRLDNRTQRLNFNNDIFSSTDSDYIMSEVLSNNLNFGDFLDSNNFFNLASSLDQDIIINPPITDSNEPNSKMHSINLSPYKNSSLSPFGNYASSKIMIPELFPSPASDTYSATLEKNPKKKLNVANSSMSNNNINNNKSLSSGGMATPMSSANSPVTSNINNSQIMCDPKWNDSDLLKNSSVDIGFEVLDILSREDVSNNVLSGKSTSQPLNSISKNKCASIEPDDSTQSSQKTSNTSSKTEISDLNAILLTNANNSSNSTYSTVNEKTHNESIPTSSTNINKTMSKIDPKVSANLSTESTSLSKTLDNSTSTLSLVKPTNEPKKPVIICTNCKTTKTPLWRRNSEGETLCNACGLFLKLHGRMRPLTLKKDVIKKRNSKKNMMNKAAASNNMLRRSNSSTSSLLNSGFLRNPNNNINPANLRSASFTTMTSTNSSGSLSAHTTPDPFVNEFHQLNPNIQLLQHHPCINSGIVPSLKIPITPNNEVAIESAPSTPTNHIHILPKPSTDINNNTNSRNGSFSNSRSLLKNHNRHGSISKSSMIRNSSSKKIVYSNNNYNGKAFTINNFDKNAIMSPVSPNGSEFSVSSETNTITTSANEGNSISGSYINTNYFSLPNFQSFNKNNLGLLNPTGKNNLTIIESNNANITSSPMNSNTNMGYDFMNGHMQQHMNLQGLHNNNMVSTNDMSSLGVSKANCANSDNSNNKNNGNNDNNNSGYFDAYVPIDQEHTEQKINTKDLDWLSW